MAHSGVSRIDPVVPEVAQGAQGQHDEEGDHAEADDDGGQHQGLGQRVRQARQPMLHQGCAVRGQAAAGEQEDVDRVAEQGQPEHHREGAGTQQEENGARRHDADQHGYQDLHQAFSSRKLRRPRPVRMSRTVPTTPR